MKKILSLLLLTSALSDVTFSMSGGGEGNILKETLSTNPFVRANSSASDSESEVDDKEWLEDSTSITRLPEVQHKRFNPSSELQNFAREVMGEVYKPGHRESHKVLAEKITAYLFPNLSAQKTNALGGGYEFTGIANQFHFYLSRDEIGKAREVLAGLSSKSPAVAAPRVDLASYSMSSSVVEPFIAEWRKFASAIGITRIEGNKETLHAFIREKLIEENAAREGAFTQEKLADIINKILLNIEGKYPTDQDKIAKLNMLYGMIIAKKLLDVPASSLPENITCSDPRIIDESTVPGTGGNTFLPIQNLKPSSRFSSPTRISMVSDDEFVRNFNFREFKEMYRTLRGSHDASPEQFLRIALNLEDSTDFRKDLQQRIRSLADVGKLPFSIAQLFWDVMSTIDARIIAQIGDALERVKVDSYGNAIIPSDSPLVTSSGDMRRSPSPLDLSSSISSLPLSPSSDLSSSGGMGGGDLKLVDLSGSVISSSSPGLSSSITASSGGMGGKLSPVGLPSSTSSLSRSPSVVGPVTEADVENLLLSKGLANQRTIDISRVNIQKVVSKMNNDSKPLHDLESFLQARKLSGYNSSQTGKILVEYLNS